MFVSTVRAAVLGGALLVPVAAVAQDRDAFFGGPPEVPQFSPAFSGQTRAPILTTDFDLATEEIAGSLTEPWAIALMPDERLLVTEQAGRLRIVTLDGAVSGPIDGVPEVDYRDQGGLLDVAVAPDFETTREIFLTYSEPLGNRTNTTTAVRARLSDDETRLENVTRIFRKEPGWRSSKHYGSRIVFDDNDTLWIALGDRSNREPRELAQDTGSHIGTVVRIHRDGSVPDDNPFADGRGGALPEVWSYGHRNIQAAVRHPETGALWTIEHGPQGGDEVNVPKPGLNYGWPVITYGENYGGGRIGTGIASQEGMEQPVYYWSPVIAPSGGTIYDGAMFPEWQGNLLVGSLRGAMIVRLVLNGERVAGEDRLLQGIGRVRDIEVLPDGSLALVTDSRGNGRVIRVSRGGAS